jgi:hypothetical protein
MVMALKFNGAILLPLVLGPSLKVNSIMNFTQYQDILAENQSLCQETETWPQVNLPARQ